jgi:hypothetical protein
LECEEEAPADVGVAAVDEGEAEGEPVGYGDSEVCEYESLVDISVDLDLQLAMKT